MQCRSQREWKQPKKSLEYLQIIPTLTIYWLVLFYTVRRFEIIVEAQQSERLKRLQNLQANVAVVFGNIISAFCISIVPLHC